MGKTLAVKVYKGVTFYVRFLYSRWYELDVVYKNQLYVHQVWIEKPHKTEKRMTLEETQKGAVAELSLAGTTLIDNLRIERSVKYRIKKLITTSWQKTQKE